MEIIPFSSFTDHKPYCLSSWSHAQTQVFINVTKSKGSFREAVIMQFFLGSRAQYNKGEANNIDVGLSRGVSGW